jgi:hypothetical protein
VYEQCDQQYWQDFRQGKALVNYCGEEFQAWRDCVDKVLIEKQRAFREKKLKTEQEHKLNTDNSTHK